MIIVMVETKIKSELIALLDGIKTADGQRIATGIGHIEKLLTDNRRELHPQLVHFLERRSYAKAAAFLGGESDIPSGACGGRP